MEQSCRRTMRGIETGLCANALPPIFEVFVTTASLPRLSKIVSRRSFFLWVQVTCGPSEETEVVLFFSLFWWLAGHCIFCWHYQCLVYTPTPLTQSFFCTSPCDVLHVFFFFCTGITAFNHMVHVCSTCVWSRCVCDYAHLVLSFTRVMLIIIFFTSFKMVVKIFSHTKRQRSSARLRLFCCCCLCCCCLSYVFVLSWLHNRVSGRWPTYLRAQTSSVEEVDELLQSYLVCVGPVITLMQAL